MSDGGDNFPSQGLDPADTGNLGGAFRVILRKFLQNTDGMLPCKVIAVTTDRNFVTVQPLIQLVGTGGTKIDRAQIAKVPVFTMGAGNFLMSFPVAKDDLGWIIASDRDISLYLQANASAAPNTGRLHSFEDGLFFPDKARQWTLAGADADKAIWQSLDGTIKVTLGSDKVEITHPSLVDITAPHVTITNGDVKAAKGYGFFGATPPGSRPVITGHLSGVTDSNAKAVLTSIIAVMTGNGEASDGTT